MIFNIWCRRRNFNVQKELNSFLIAEINLAINFPLSALFIKIDNKLPS
jgi:hypothetical protein